MKTKSNKLFITVCLAAIFALILFCGCSGQNDESTPNISVNTDASVTVSDTEVSEGITEDVSNEISDPEESIPAEHTHEYADEWSSNGTDHWHECECGDKADIANHTFGEWTTTKEATEETEGSKYHTCAECGYKETVTVPVISHSHSFETWKNNDTSHWKECGCGEKSSLSGHTYGDWTIIVEPTIDDTGTKKRVCATCEFYEICIISKLNSGTTTPEISTPENNMPETSGDATQNAPDYEETMRPYEGTWYLNGYADVYISLYNIYESGGWVSLSLDAFNIAIPTGKSSPVSPYTVYPYDAFVENPSEDYWSSGFQIMCDTPVWQEEIAKHNMQLGDNCIYLGGKQFVREKGSITMYDDTCYRALALDSEMYMEGNPDAYIYIYKRQDLDSLGDYIEISIWGFDLNTFEKTNAHSSIRLYAARKNNWDKYGIQVKNGVLSISNSNGTKRFHRNAIKITGKTDINLNIGETEKLYAMVLPQATTEQSVTWTSSDTSVATVSENIVKAVGKGTAILTATSKIGGHTATCKITVTEPPLTVSAHISDGVEFSGSNIYTIVTASISKNGGSGKYTVCVLKLYHNGILICETSENSVTVLKESGEYRVEVYVKDSSGNEATATKTTAF